MFAPGFVNYKKGALDSQPQVIKFTDILVTEIVLTVTLNTITLTLTPTNYNS